MSRRLVCCPYVGEEETSLRYLYVDSLDLRVEDVTNSLSVFDENLRKVCCFDRLAEVLNNRPDELNGVEADLPFDFKDLHSFEVFRNPEELRLKTGSEKLLYSCLLNYYRREYDGTQQHTFFSDPRHDSRRHGGVEHELTLEERVWIKKEEEEVELETLDKGKSAAELEMEELLAQLEAEMLKAEQETDDKAKKKEKRDNERKIKKRRDAERQANKEQLASQYDKGDFSSLPGYIEPDDFSETVAPSEQQASDNAADHSDRYDVSSSDLYSLASRMDEFGVPYTVQSEMDEDGAARHSVCYFRDDARAAQAIRFYEMEQHLREAGAIPADGYFNAYQLRVLDYAYKYDVDTSLVTAENFHVPQIMQVLESGVFREFRNQDDAQSVAYSQFKLYEEEMRANNDYLASQYDNGNFASLPGYVSPDDFYQMVAPSERQTAFYPLDKNDSYVLSSSDLYSLASRLDEFGVPYTVFSEQQEDGIVRHAVCYSRDNVRALQATQFYELEQKLRADGAIPSKVYFNAFQLQALGFAHENDVDTSYINTGHFSGTQMMRIVVAGARGHDMSILANPKFSAAQLDTICYFVEKGWDSYDVEQPGMSTPELANSIIREEGIYKVGDGDRFFDHCDYNSFIKLGKGTNRRNYLNDYDSAYRARTFSQDGNILTSRSAWNIPQIPPDAPEDVYVKHPNPLVRQKAVQMGYGLETLIKDRDPYVRAEVAKRGYGLESLIHDKSPVVRLAVAERGFGMSTLAHDSAASVRMAVARKGYGLSDLTKDDSWNVRKAAKMALLEQQQGAQPNPVLDKVKNSYSWAAAYTPDGRIKSDASFVPGATNSRHHRNGPSGGERTSVGSGGGRPPANPPSEGPKGRKKHPLDELQVRSSFGERVGLRVESFGKRALARGSRLATYSVRTVAGSIVRDDDTGTMPLIYRTARNAGMVAHLVVDTPKMFGKPGSGVSFTYSAIQQTRDGRPGTVKTVSMPLRSALWNDQIQAAERRHVSYITKRFGVQSTRLSIKDIDSQIIVWENKLVDFRKYYLPVNRNFKAELKDIDIASDLFNKKNALVLENRKLKDEILTLQRKNKRTMADERLLAEKIKKKLDNEAEIKALSRKIPDVKLLKEKEALIRKGRKLKSEIRDLQGKKNLTQHDKKILADKIREKQHIERKIKKVKGELDRHVEGLRKQKFINEGKIKNAGRKIKDLKDLKRLKLAFEKDLKGLEKILNRAYAAERRLKSLPGLLVDQLVNKMYQSGDYTLTGIAQASGFAMTFVQNPIVRILLRPVNSIFAKTPEKKAAKAEKAAAAEKKAAAAEKKAAVEKKAAAGMKAEEKAAKKPKKLIRKQEGSKIRAQKKDGKLLSRVRRTMGAKASPVGKDFAVRAKGVKSWIKQTRKAVVDKVVSAAKSAAASVKGVASGTAVVAGGGTASAIGTGLLLFVVLILAVGVIALIGSAASSFVITPQTDSSDSNKIDLSYYVDLVNSHQETLEKEIRSVSSATSSATGKAYDNVFYDYVGKNNTLQIIAMTYVRFGFDLAVDEDAVEAYIEQLYKDSNFVDSAESALYACSNGCTERHYYCYEEPDEYASETRISLYEASSSGGCTTETYSCMEQGNSIYNQYGCFRHNDGVYMRDPGDCSNFELTEHGYLCLGHCSGDHKDVICTGHTETVCYGEHQDLTVTITSLGFDDIFYADSSLASSGSYVRGEAYDQNFVISAYCSCHECCHPYDPECTGQPSKTATGTTPKAKHTLAVDANNPVVPLGTHVWIDGVEYVVEDTGDLAANGRDFDMYFEDHDEAIRWGVRTKTVYKSVEVADEDSSEGAGDPYGFDGWTEENILIVKNIYEIMTGDDADEIYIGLDGIVQLSYGDYTGDYDFSELVFSEVDPNSLTSLQKAVLDVIESNKVETKNGYCQAWVADVYQYAGANGDSRCCANHAGEDWGVSNDWADIQVAATVYGYSSSIYGHVGIYIGNGLVAHNIGYLKIESLESWVNTYNGVCWGWNGGHNLTGNSAYDCKPDGTFMKGKD